MKYEYEISINSEYWDKKVCDLEQKYCCQKNTLKEAKQYASSIKKEIKEMFKDEKDNTIIIEVDKYSADGNEYFGLVHSLYIAGRY